MAVGKLKWRLRPIVRITAQGPLQEHENQRHRDDHQHFCSEREIQQLAVRLGNRQQGSGDKLDDQRAPNPGHEARYHDGQRLRTSRQAQQLESQHADRRHDHGDTQNMNGLDGGYEPPQILKSLAYRRSRQPVTKLVDHSRLLCRFAAHLVRQSLWKATVRRNR
jgi:hypothetical protein